jgi:RNA polymerase sigma-70 factor (ECF subfamily)
LLLKASDRVGWEINRRYDLTPHQMDPESSFELMAKARAGDSAALDRLLARYRPRLQRWATGRLPRYARELADTDDLVQDALIGTFKNLPAFEQRGEWALQAYLRQAVTNRIRDEIRRFAARPRREDMPTDLVAHGASPLEAAVGQQLFEHYERALVALSDIDREAVIARLELGCSYQEVALLVDKPSAAAARMAVARALAHLATLMSNM